MAPWKEVERGSRIGGTGGDRGAKMDLPVTSGLPISTTGRGGEGRGREGKLFTLDGDGCLQPHVPGRSSGTWMERSGLASHGASVHMGAAPWTLDGGQTACCPCCDTRAYRSLPSWAGLHGKGGRGRHAVRREGLAGDVCMCVHTCRNGRVWDGGGGRGRVEAGGSETGWCPRHGHHPRRKESGGLRGSGLGIPHAGLRGAQRGGDM